MRLEVDRGTVLGSKIKEAIDKGQSLSQHPELIVNVLKHVIYSGIDGHNKFLLVGFPQSIQEASVFEKHCAMITAIVYTASKGQSTVEIKGNDLGHKNLDTLFAKELRLKTMSEWDTSTFEDHLGKKV